jgi:hypothetical protein
MTTDRINSNKLEIVEKEMVGYHFVYKEKCQGCLSLDYRFYHEPKIIVKAHFCKMLTYSRDILVNCPCTQCLVKLMCKQKEQCHILKDFIKELTEEKKHREGKDVKQ